MKLLTKEIERKLPGLNETDENDDPMVWVKFFTPDSNWTWFGVEYDPEERRFFGMVHGFEKELGYFMLDELETTRGPMGLPIERDLYWTPCPLSEVQR